MLDPARPPMPGSTPHDSNPLSPHARSAALALGLALVITAVVNLAPRLGYFSGDALIHVIIAEQAAAGRWFEFNPGEVSSGTTSFAWTALEATLLRLGGHGLMLRAVPLIDLAGLLTTGALVRSLALRLGASRLAALLGAVVFVSIPAVTYNAVLGMENIVFAAAALLFIDRWVASARAPRSAATLAGLGVILGLAALLRPEGALLGVVPLVDALTRRAEARTGASASPIPRSAIDCAAVGAAALAVMTPMLLKHHAITGHWTPGSGLSRVMTARRDATSLHLGPLWVYLGTLSRFVIYAPITALALVGARRTPLDESARLARRAMLAALAGGLVLYTLITGAGHVGRLTQWLFALVCALAAAGLAPAWERLAVRPRLRALIFITGALAHLGLVGAETTLRLLDTTQRHGGADFASLEAMRANRRATTDETLRLVCGGGCCREGVAPALGFTEVQARFAYDARLRVVSFDGRTTALSGTSRRVSFDDRACPHIGEMLDDPDLVAVPEPPYFQFRHCPMDPVGRLLTTEWNAASPRAPAGWRWEPRLPGWVRVCEGSPSVTR